jgi:hypothetical protein
VFPHKSPFCRGNRYKRLLKCHAVAHIFAVRWTDSLRMGEASAQCVATSAPDSPVADDVPISDILRH